MTTIFVVVYGVKGHQNDVDSRIWDRICELFCKNVPNASCSNAERNGKRAGDERLGKPFETGTMNG